MSHSPSIPPHALPPAIDAERLEEATGGDAEFEAEIIATFVEDTGTRIESLAAAATANNLSVIATEAHTIKGASANVGATRMRDLAARIEKAAKTGDNAAMVAIIGKLAYELKRIQAR